MDFFRAQFDPPPLIMVCNPSPTGAPMADRTAALARTVRAAARRIAPPQTNGDLLAAILHGDPAAFDKLVRRYGPLVRAACRAVLADAADADDAFQATFVALHRKAHTIRDNRTLGGWLFRVARRTALGVKAAGARRRDCETRVARREPVAGPDVSWQEACAVLHEELDRLPPRYRLPLIVCYLDGKTRDEAAAELGWTPDSVRGRLDRGRSRLRQRLEKRGITLSAFLLAAVAADAVPPNLVATTLAAARSSGPGLSLLAAAWKAGLTAGLAAAVVVGLTFQKDGAHGQPSPEKPKAVAETSKKVDPEPPKTATVSGVVVGTNGSGVCMARVIFRRQDQKDEEGVTATTDPAGRFSATIPAVSADTSMVAVSVGNEAFAGGWQTWTGPPPKELRLVEVRDDVPIQGRIFDLEGKPLAGVTVRVRAVHAIPDGGPQAFVDWLTRIGPRPTQSILQSAPPGATDKVVTGADGKFRLTGLGRDRVIQLHVSGTGIAHEIVYVGTVQKLSDPGGPRANKTYAATFDHPVSPARLIRGTARNIDTGKPVPGLAVNGYGGAATTTTDADGHFELPGYKKGPRYTIYARPADGSIYFPTMAEAADTAGLAPLDIDLKVRAGVPVRGRLKDAATGKAVAGTVRYWAFAGNTNVSGVPVGEKAGEYFTVDVRTKPDGTFTCATLPGPGFLAITAEGSYRPARVDPTGFTAEVGAPSDVDNLAVAVGGMAVTRVPQEPYHAIQLLKVDPAKPSGEQMVELTPAEPIRGQFVDPEGKPLAGVKVRGLHQTGESWSEPLPTAEFMAAAPHPDRPRRLTFRHDGRKLIGTALVKAGGTDLVDFRLEPSATVTGRLLDTDGRPIVRAMITVPVNLRDARTTDTIQTGTVFTDATGRFTLNGLLPGVEYRFYYRDPQARRRGGPFTDELKFRAGEDRDLGEVRVSRES
jgi:RNA polymerase sigma factor (sigma-70 family)